MNKLLLLSLSFSLFLAAKSAVALSPELTRPETKTTKSGHVFVRDYSQPRLGKAWLDENGVIWGYPVVGSDGYLKPMSWKAATAYCRSIGAELPSESDYKRLRKYMGAEMNSSKGFTPEILAGLELNSVITWYWTSSYHPLQSSWDKKWTRRNGDWTSEDIEIRYFEIMRFHTDGKIIGTLEKDWSRDNVAYVRCVAHTPKEE